MSQVSHLICAIKTETLVSLSPALPGSCLHSFGCEERGAVLELTRGPFPVLDGFYSFVSYSSVKYLKKHTLASELSSNFDMAAF